MAFIPEDIFFEIWPCGYISWSKNEMANVMLFLVEMYRKLRQSEK
jgi:hypothetical protein